jgi:hypothetical protein
MNFFADDPIDGSPNAPDRLDRENYARTLSQLLDRVRLQSESSVLALIGPWGGGKSSVLKIVTDAVVEADWRVAEFNPWGYADLDQLLTGFLSELYLTLPKDERPNGARAAVGGFIRTISPLGKLGGLVGLDLETPVDAAGRAIVGDSSPSARRRSAVEAMRRVRLPILMILDDLDRLSPTELLLVFKLVRLVGRLPNVYYLLSYDEETLLDVVSRTELCADNESRARAYLEKIVQVRLDLPPLRASQAQRMLFDGLEEIGSTIGVDLDTEARARLDRVYEVSLAERLDTPRAINRYLAQIDALYASLVGEVDFADFVLLTFLRTFEPRLYAALPIYKADLTVDGEWYPRAGDDATEEVWRRRLMESGATPTACEGLLAVLRELFPRLRAIKGLPERVSDSLAADRSVAHLDYFDRYFSFAVPGDDVRDSFVGGTLAALPTLAEDAPDRLALLAQIVADPVRLTRKLRLLRTNVKSDVDAALLELLVQAYGMLGESPYRGDAVAGQAEVAGLAAVVLAAAPEVLALVIERLTAEAPDALALITHAIEQFLEREPTPISGPAAAAFSAAAMSALSDQCATPFLDLPPETSRILRVWCVVDPETCRTWLRANSNRDAWRTLDVVASLIPARRRTDGDAEAELAVGDFRPDLLESLLGVSYVAAELREDVDLDKHSLPRRPRDTPENRRAAALHVLKQLRR